MSKLEEVEVCFRRATIAVTVSRKCQEANLTEAARFFSNKAIYLLAQGFKLLAEREQRQDG